MRKKTLIAVTPGDPEGIGPEIVWKTLQSKKSFLENAQLLCVGAREPFDRMGAPVMEINPEEIDFGIAPPKRKGPFVWLLGAPKKAPGYFLPGFQCGWAVENATHLVLKGIASALVTGPISKERLQRGGYLYPGHTEFLADLCGKKDVTMMLANETLRISLVTTHLALKDVPRKLTRAAIRRCTLHTADVLRSRFGIQRPKIAVAALNPHAGEAGLFGREEIKIIEPEIRAMQKQLRGRCELSGPHPADTLFAKHYLSAGKDRYDAVVCMYHDQGLIPVKLLDFPNTVNITLGLPIVRTSVDHGTGFDIAGKGIADPSSFQSATRMAIEMTRGLKPNRRGTK